MNTGRNSKQPTCLCRDTGGKGTLLAQHTSFNTFDNWGHRISTQSKRERTTGKKRLKGHGPGHTHCTQLHLKGYGFLKTDTIITKFASFLSFLKSFIRLQVRVWRGWSFRSKCKNNKTTVETFFCLKYFRVTCSLDKEPIECVGLSLRCITVEAT